MKHTNDGPIPLPKKDDEESQKIDQELLDLISKNESIKKGITKLVEQMEKTITKELN